MDTELEGEVRRAIASKVGVALLPPAETEALRMKVASAFEFDQEEVWWWTRTSAKRNAIEYGSQNGLQVLRTLLAQRARGLVSLFITDDEPPPWLCLRGELSAVVEVLEDIRFVEYFVTDDTLEWVVFDTHHNELVDYVGPSE